MNKCHSDTELSSHEGTRCQFNGGPGAIKLGIDVHQDFYVVVMQEGGTNPKPPQRFQKEAFLHWAAKLKSQGTEVHAVYEACGFGFSLQRQLSALGVHCHVICPQKLDEQNRRVKTDGLDAKALCLELDRFVEGNRSALALVRVPSEEEEQKRAIHRQREQLVKARKQLEAQGRSLMVNHGLEPVKSWWRRSPPPALHRLQTVINHQTAPLRFELFARFEQSLALPVDSALLFLFLRGHAYQRQGGTIALYKAVQLQAERLSIQPVSLHSPVLLVQLLRADHVALNRKRAQLALQRKTKSTRFIHSVHLGSGTGQLCRPAQERFLLETLRRLGIGAVHLLDHHAKILVHVNSKLDDSSAAIKLAAGFLVV